MNTRNWIRASVSRASPLRIAGEPEDDHPRQVGVVELVGRLGRLMDDDVAVAVDHPVGIVAGGGAGPGLLDHHHLGLDVQGGFALRAPDDLHGQGDDGGPEQHDEEGDDPGGLAAPWAWRRGRRAWPRRSAGHARRPLGP